MIKHSVRISGHPTSVSLEEEFWDELRNIAKRKSKSLNQLVSEIDEQRSGNLSSAIRVYILNDLKKRHSFQ